MNKVNHDPLRSNYMQLENTDWFMYCHDYGTCVEEYCTLHERSNHSMRDFPQHWRGDRGIMERICTHGIGHPDPDDYRLLKGEDDGIHGCDGCCQDGSPINYPIDYVAYFRSQNTTQNLVPESTEVSRIDTCWNCGTSEKNIQEKIAQDIKNDPILFSGRRRLEKLPIESIIRELKARYTAIARGVRPPPIAGRKK